jgi:hypothetical protein
VKDVECFGSAGSWSKVFTAGDALGDWLSFRLRERNMPEGGDGAGHGLWDVQRRLVLLEVRDECSYGDIAGGLGYGFSFCQSGRTAA